MPTTDRGSDPVDDTAKWVLMFEYGLSQSARTILMAIARSGPATRPVLSSRVKLSKPTVSVAIGELVEHGLVQEEGSSYGATGRSAVVYGLGPAGGYVHGIDIGRTRTVLRTCALDGTEIDRDELEIDTHRDPRRELEIAHDLIEKMDARLGDAHGPLRAIALALPTTISEDFVADVPFADYAGQVEEALPGTGTPVIIENNVNCAAIGELYYGAGDGVDTFCYLQMGTRIGAGLIMHRRLIRGVGGFAGEISNIPYPWSGDAVPEPLGMETHLGAGSLVARAKELWPAGSTDVPDSAVELFRRAAEGSEIAKEITSTYARDIGRLAAALDSVLDPGLIVLGGGVGQNPLLLDDVRAELAYLGRSVTVETTRLQDDATVLGAARLASGLGLELVAGAGSRGESPAARTNRPVGVARALRVR